MFITKKHLSRRTVLRGLGVSLGLPLLDAMVPAGTALAKTAAAPQPRLAFVYFPHGAVMDQWTPKATGAAFDVPPILAPLAPYRKYLTVVSGLENTSAIAAPVHATTPGTWLSCVAPRIGHEPCGGITIDQIAARRIGQATPLPSLEVATEEQGGEGSCDRNYGCCYGKTIAFRAPSQPLPMEHDPRTLFQRLFGPGDAAHARATLAPQRSSIIDLVRGEAADLNRTLGARDRARLADYLGSVREIERRIERLAIRELAKPRLPAAGIASAFDERMRLMVDLVALAFQANMTRIATCMLAAEVSHQPYPFIDVADAFHRLSHHQNDPQKMARLARVQTFNTSVFAGLVKKLSELPDGEGSMLDNSIIVFGSNMSNSNMHDHFPLPTAILGLGAGKIKGHQHLRYPDRTPLANLHVALLNRAGIPTERFGDSTGELAEI
ncbi:MAG TPA: DUF1552 domain-containing protein [Steroidobacteraceae bacterium]|nr:DUF1552 domain-containing protein [Steroidobacteraceae bacterium]